MCVKAIACVFECVRMYVCSWCWPKCFVTSVVQTNIFCDNFVLSVKHMLQNTELFPYLRSQTSVSHFMLVFIFLFWLQHLLYGDFVIFTCFVYNLVYTYVMYISNFEGCVGCSDVTFILLCRYYTTDYIRF